MLLQSDGVRNMKCVGGRCKKNFKIAPGEKEFIFDNAAYIQKMRDTYDTREIGWKV